MPREFSNVGNKAVGNTFTRRPLGSHAIRCALEGTERAPSRGVRALLPTEQNHRKEHGRTDSVSGSRQFRRLYSRGRTLHRRRAPVGLGVRGRRPGASRLQLLSATCRTVSHRVLSGAAWGWRPLAEGCMSWRPSAEYLGSSWVASERRLTLCASRGVPRTERPVCKAAMGRSD